MLRQNFPKADPKNRSNQSGQNNPEDMQKTEQDVKIK